MPAADACTLLDEDHQRVAQLFAEYQSLDDGDAANKQSVAHILCTELTVHATLEEELFYPAFRKATGDAERIEEAQQDHREARELIAQIEASGQPDQLIAQLQQAIDQHVQEERTEIFTKARSTPGLDLARLATQLQERKAELMREMQAV